MDLKQAVEILNNAIAQVNTTRQGHALMSEALKLILSTHPELKHLVMEQPEKK